MFNLIMINTDWMVGRVTVPMGRIFEFTDEHIAARFRDNGTILLDQLSDLPCLFCEEGKANEIVYVGKINRARLVGRDVSLEVSIDRDVPQLTNSFIYENRTELHMPHEFEFSRNHWSVKDVDLYRFLLQKAQHRRLQPSVFRISEHENIVPTLVSAMMPFDERFSAVSDTIRKAANSIGLECKRADDIWENASIIQDVVALIDRSRIVVCDCSGRNSNVFYEAGIAHTLGREVILITQSEHDIPFDLRHLRYIHYLNNTEGRETLARALQMRMLALLGR